MKVDEGDVMVDEGDVTVDDVDVTVDDLVPMTGRPRPYTHGHVASGCVYLQKSRCKNGKIMLSPKPRCCIPREIVDIYVLKCKSWARI